MSMLQMFACGAPTPGPGGPTAVKFDGFTNYLAKTGGIGASDGTMLTFSYWSRVDATASPGYVNTPFCRGNGSDITACFLHNGASFYVRIMNSARTGTIIGGTQGTPKYYTGNTWHHVSVSIDSSGDHCHIYVDDVQVYSGALTGAVGGATGTMSFSGTDTWYSGGYDGVNFCSGAFQHIYFCPGLYLDLSNSANRRLFNKYDGNNQLVPANQDLSAAWPGSTTPAIYLKLNDPSTAGTNLGSGGNFTAYGALAKASSAPDDRNVNAVGYTGSSGGYLTKTALGADAKTLTLSLWVHAVNNYTTTPVFIDQGGGSAGIRVEYYRSLIYFSACANGHNSTGWRTFAMSAGAWHHLLFAVDTGNNKCLCYLDGVAQSTTGTITNENIFLNTPVVVGASTVYGQKLTGNIAELYFTNTYLDISNSTNLAKFVTGTGAAARPVYLGADGSTPTGTAPLVYLPHTAANCEVNAGSGGNFTRNGVLGDAHSSPFYYYAEPVKYDGMTSYLSKSADLTGSADGKAGTFSAWVRLDGGNAALQRIFANLAGTLRFHVARNASNKIVVTGINSAASTILLLTSAASYTAAPQWVHVCAAWDLAATTGYLYINGVSDLAGGATLTNDTIDYAVATPNWAVGADTTGANFLNGCLADLFFHDTFIDISSPTNLAKFIDATSLRPAGNLITTTGLTPLVYLPLAAPNENINSGSGGNFTINGTIIAADSSPSDIKAA